MRQFWLWRFFLSSLLVYYGWSWAQDQTLHSLSLFTCAIVPDGFTHDAHEYWRWLGANDLRQLNLAFPLSTGTLFLVAEVETFQNIFTGEASESKNVEQECLPEHKDMEGVDLGNGQWSWEFRTPQIFGLIPVSYRITGVNYRSNTIPPVIYDCEEARDQLLKVNLVPRGKKSDGTSSHTVDFDCAELSFMLRYSMDFTHEAVQGFGTATVQGYVSFGSRKRDSEVWSSSGTTQTLYYKADF